MLQIFQIGEDLHAQPSLRHSAGDLSKIIELFLPEPFLYIYISGISQMALSTSALRS